MQDTALLNQLIENSKIEVASEIKFLKIIPTKKFKNEFSVQTDSLVLIAEEKELTLFDKLGNKLSSVTLDQSILDL